MALQPFTGQLDPAPAAPALVPFTGELDPVKGQGGGVLQNIGAGIARGAKDVIDTGAQILASGFDKIAGTKEGERVQAMNKAGASEFEKAYGGSTAASVGRVGGQVLATLPVGGALGAGARAAGAGALGDAIATGGLQAQGAGLATRALGGAIQGGATAGLVNPDDAAAGAAIGAAVPLAARALGTVGSAIGRTVRGPEVPEGVRAAAQAGADVGYVVPPTQVRPSLANRVLEGAAGKISTAQNASARNQEVTNRLARQTLGIAEDAPLSVETLDAIRADAGKAYADIARLGPLDATGAKLPDTVGVRRYTDPYLINRTEVDSANLIESWKQANHDATAYYRAYGRDANPETLAKAKAAAGQAKQIDAFLNQALAGSGQQDLLTALKDARVRIAKTHSVEAALNPTTGNVDAGQLAKQLQKGKKLSGGLEQAAAFSAAFPKATQTLERMGSLPQVSPLDFAAAGGIGAVTGSPLALAGLVARPAARAAVLAGPIQRSLAKAPQASSLAALALNPSAAALAGRAAPVALAGPDH